MRKKMLLVVLLALISDCSAVSKFYESHSGKELTLEEYRQHVKSNNTFWCTNEIELPCDPSEGRRLDGSCNNLKNFTIGTAHTPPLRILPPYYSDGFEPRLTKRGNKLPLPRSVRTSLLLEGHVPDQRFTQLLTYFLVFIAADFVSTQDSVNYVLWKPYCCAEKGKKDHECIPNSIPNDDPVHRFSDIRCLNLTRPISFQSVGCVPNNTVPERVISGTPIFDFGFPPISIIYGSNMKTLNEKGRLFEKGMLKYETENGKIWPPSAKSGQAVCYLNQGPQETRCHDMPEFVPNTILGTNLMSVWIWRYHNIIASALADINPCWDDTKLFFTTRDIVIASIVQILYYELLPLLMDRDNLIRDGVISPDLGFRDIYDDNLGPQVAIESPIAWRWFHTIQEGNIKLYDNKGYHLKDIKYVNMTLRTGYVAETIEFITQGAIRQPLAAFDNAVDADMAEVALGPLQKASDVFTDDLTKSRYFFLAPYIKYREYCFGDKIKSYDDLAHVFKPELLEVLKEKYEDVEDIDFSAGLWLENQIPGGLVPATFYCIVSQQQYHFVASDRHWYERPNRPNAFTLDQLMEIRKSTMAALLCAVGDTITEVQPQAFVRPGQGNEMRSCSQIEKLNIRAWHDPTCSNGDNKR